MSDVAIERNTLDRLAMKVSGVTNELPPLTLEEMITALDTAAHTQVHPHGTIPITENGQVDVTAYATADVQVPTGNEFLVTVSYNSSADLWLADKTYAELYEAYSAGKTIVWKTGMLAEVATVAGEFHSGASPYFSYYVRAIPSQGSVQEYGYELSASGLVQSAYNHYFQPSGNLAITQNGNNIDVTNYSTVSVNVSSSSKNIQGNFDRKQRTANSYGDTGLSLTVSKTGTYKVYWTAWRSSSSGTMGTNLHRNSTTGTNQQTFTGTYGQNITLTNQSYNAGDVLTLYATSGSTTRSIYVANLIIVEQ